MSELRTPPPVTRVWTALGPTAFEVSWDTEGAPPTAPGAWLLQLELHPTPDEVVRLGAKFIDGVDVWLFRHPGLTPAAQESIRQPWDGSGLVAMGQRQQVIYFPLPWVERFKGKVEATATVSWSGDEPTHTVEVNVMRDAIFDWPST